MQPRDQRIRSQRGVKTLKFIRSNEGVCGLGYRADHAKPLRFQVLRFVHQHDGKTRRGPGAHLRPFEQHTGRIALRIILVLAQRLDTKRRGETTPASQESPREAVDGHAFEASLESRNAPQLLVQPAPRAMHEGQRQDALSLLERCRAKRFAQGLHQPKGLAAAGRALHREEGHGLKIRM